MVNFQPVQLAFSGQFSTGVNTRLEKVSQSFMFEGLNHTRIVSRNVTDFNYYLTQISH